MIKLFYGKDAFSIKREIKTLTEVPETEVSVFEAEEIETAAMSILTQSIFATKRVFVCRGMLSKADASAQKTILNALSKKPAETTVVFVEDELPKKSKALDQIKNDGTVKEFIEPKGRDLLQFIKRRVEEEGGEIAPLAAERLASFVGSDLWQVEEEIKKLVLYRKDQEETLIQTADVDLLVKANFEANIFALLDAIAGKNNRKSVELLNSFLDSGENGIYIFSMIVKQFRNIAAAKFEDKITDAQLAKKMGIHPFVAKKSIEQARNFEKTEIINIYKKLRWGDLKLKSGYEPGQVLLRVIVG